jgi:tripartite-type tricarboxylate transporter receptor subunit TctC
MNRRAFIALAGAAAGSWSLPGRAAEEYPSRPARIVVPVSAGGATDTLARRLAEKLTERLHAGFYVENKTGAGSLIGTDLVAKSRADGYTLVIGGLFNMVMLTPLVKNPPFHPDRDFTAVGYLAAYPFVVIVRPDMPVVSLAEFVAYAKERPGMLSYGSSGLGTLQHVWGTILLRSLGLDLLHIPYRGATAALQDMMGGRIDFMFDNLAAVRAYIESGDVKALAVSSAKRTVPLPQVPTINESGLTKFEGESWFGLFAPSGTPSPVVDTLRREVSAITAEPEFAQQIERDAGRVLTIEPERQADFLKFELQRWTEQIARYGIKAE